MMGDGWVGGLQDSQGECISELKLVSSGYHPGVCCPGVFLSSRCAYVVQVCIRILESSGVIFCLNSRP